MSSTDSTPRPVETGPHPNREVIDGLREVADWLAEHPELPLAYYASISFGYELKGPTARERLTDLAEALGDRAEERDPYPGRKEIVIDGKFGPVTVSASALKRALLSEPAPEPQPEPIIARPVVEERAA